MRISPYGIFDQLGEIKYTQENDGKDIELYRFLHCANVQVRYYFWLLEFIEYLLHGQHFKNISLIKVGITTPTSQMMELRLRKLCV